MLYRELKTVTVNGTRFDQKTHSYAKFKLKVGDKIMHGHYGVLAVDEIRQLDNKAWTRTVVMCTNTGKRIAFQHDTNKGMIQSNFLFKIKEMLLS